MKGIDNNDVTYVMNIAASNSSKFAKIVYYLIVKLRAKKFTCVSLWLR